MEYISLAAELSMEMSKILVTGAAGFIGSHLSESLLSAGHQVIGIDNFDPFYDRSTKERNLTNLLQHPEFTLIEGDIRNISELNISAIDAVVHLAAKAGVLPSMEQPQEYVSVNINGTQAVLEWMRTKGIRKYVFASSSSIYGNNEKVPFSEQDPVDHPISVYAATKKACELLNHTYHKLFGIDTINLRFFTVYGPRQRPDLAINKFVRLIKNDQTVTLYGDGSTARDYTFVGDTVAGIELALEHVMTHDNLYEVYNLGNGSPVKLSDLVDLLQTALGKKANVKHTVMQPGDVDRTFASIEKAKLDFGYDPKTTFLQGIAQYVDWTIEPTSNI